jgi:hypothetical protein
MGAKIYTIDESVGSVIAGYDTCCHLYIRLLESYLPKRQQIISTEHILLTPEVVCIDIDEGLHIPG